MTDWYEEFLSYCGGDNYYTNKAINKYHHYETKRIISEASLGKISIEEAGNQVAKMINDTSLLQDILKNR